MISVVSPAVLGGGIAGLSAAYYLSKVVSDSVCLFEGASRTGGWIRSLRRQNGTLYELGPRTMRLVGPPGTNMLQLIEELGLEKQITPVLKSAPAAKIRMLYVDGKLHPLPTGISGVLLKTPPFKKPLAMSLVRDLFAPAVKLEDDSIYNFVERRFGSEVADYAISSLVCGVCAGDAKKISVNLLMPKPFEWEQQFGGIFKGLWKSRSSLSTPVPDCELMNRAKKEGWSVWSLSGGLEKLPSRLEEVLRGTDNVELHVDAPCQEITFNDSEVKVNINGQSIHTDHLFSALPSNLLAQLIPKEHQVLRDELANIPYVTVGLVNLEYTGNVLPVEGFGFLVPPNQNVPILGVIFDSCTFPQDGKTVLTVMMGGAWFETHFGSKPKREHLLETAVKEVKKALNLTVEPCDSNVSILENCIPQYIVGHKARVARIREYITAKKLPLSLLGSSYDGVGVNDVVMASRRAVDQLPK